MEMLTLVMTAIPSFLAGIVFAYFIFELTQKRQEEKKQLREFTKTIYTEDDLINPPTRPTLSLDELSPRKFPNGDYEILIEKESLVSDRLIDFRFCIGARYYIENKDCAIREMHYNERECCYQIILSEKNK
jgi:hypothetical protein